MTNQLCLNATKTQLIWFGTRQQLSKFDFQLLTEKFSAYTYSSNVHDLGVTFNSSLTFTEHISNLTRSCFFQLRRLRTISRSVSFFCLYHHSTRVYLFPTRILQLTSYGPPKQRLCSLQSVLNASARLKARLPRVVHISILCSMFCTGFLSLRASIVRFCF